MQIKKRDAAEQEALAVTEFTRKLFLRKHNYHKIDFLVQWMQKEIVKRKFPEVFAHTLLKKTIAEPSHKNDFIRNYGLFLVLIENASTDDAQEIYAMLLSASKVR